MSYSSYLTSSLSAVSSKYTNLRRALTNSEADGDTEDDTNISRVLRAYYTEKGRPFPPWLPPDPNGRQPPPAQIQSSVPGSLRQQGGMPSRGSGGALSDLWDAPSSTPEPVQPQSLRRGGAPAGAPGGGRWSAPQSQQQQRGNEINFGGPSRPDTGPRTQSGSSFNLPSQQGSIGGGAGTSAQERLKARLLGGGGSGRNSPSTPPPGASGRDSPASNPYQPPPPASSGYNSGGGGGRQQQQQTFSNSPWSSGGDAYGPGGGYDAPQAAPSRFARDRVGLPSGPRPKR